MIPYPSRKNVGVREYREQCVGGAAWQLIDSLATGKRAMLFLPGSWHFAAVGFLAALPIGITVVFILQTLFDSEPVEFRGTFMLASIAALITIHGLFMLRVSLGFVYAQQDLVLYLYGLLTFTVGCAVYGLLAATPYSYLLLPIISSVLIFIIIHIAKSLPFTLYADLMRVKRVYFREQKDSVRRSSE